ncbi:Leucine aminopeptidase [Mycena indigotica]|uniref:Leucine aminopeptidase n=1 Tax=Mycena indigotica TaxID=2126181 RepID=A0A8H6VZF8_9AGAR|nr:Leucine aminopeptidase [Mycena indigotica]KAF7297466.1 Leucine aminopeptidase [Mycena indigotica]
MSTATVHLFDPTAPTQPASKLWPNPSTASLKAGSSRVFHDREKDSVTALGSLGPDFASKTGNARREAVRRQVGGLVKELASKDYVEQVLVDTTHDAHAAAVAAHLATYKFTLKTEPAHRLKANGLKPLDASVEWDRGVVYAEAQNLARTLMELPANMLTPTLFAQRIHAEFSGVENTEVIVRDEAWAKEKGMRTFLSVCSGTFEPGKFVEIHYNGASSKEAAPLVLVGKGITFDSGGISLKPSADMKLMRGDMGGAASVVSAILAIAKLKLPINVVALTPLAENMPSGTATRPGDIIYAMNGKSIEVDNTDAEGRLVLADAIYYGSTEFKAHTLIDVATLTYAMDIALGEVFTGVFSSSDALWEKLHAAGETEYDRFWRMPLDEDYGPQIYSSNADLCNTGGKPGGSATAALFLKHFVHGLGKTIEWAHIDIAGTMEATREKPYLLTGMTGSSVRGLIEYARNLGQGTN